MVIKLSILIVEDEPIIALNLKKNVEKNGYTVIGTADSGDTAIQLFKQYNPGLILMDIKIKGDIDGIETALKINEIRRVPFILMTGYGDEQSIERAKEIGPYAYLIKPIKEADLNAAIKISLYKFQTENRISQLNNFLKFILESLDNMFCIISVKDYSIKSKNSFGFLETEKERVMCYKYFYNLDEPCEDNKCIMSMIKREKTSLITEYKHVDENNSNKTYEVYGYPIFDDNKELTHIIEYRVDITDKNKIEKDLMISEERYNLAARAANDGLWDWDIEKNEIYFSPRWKNMLGFEDSEIGKNPEEWINRVHSDDRANLEKQIDAHLTGSTTHLICEYRIMDKEGVYRWVICRGLAKKDDSGKFYRIAGSQKDIQALKEAENKLIHDTLFDHVTGLPNRVMFLDRLSYIVDNSIKQKNYQFAVLYLDITEYKAINESLGHNKGDNLLSEISGRILNCIGEGNMLSRISGGEFAVLIYEIKNIYQATEIADDIQQSLKPQIAIDDYKIFVSANIGITLGSEDYNNGEEMLRDADMAMFRAKSSGKSRYEIYDVSMHAQIIHRLKTEESLRNAIEKEEFVLYYQPIIDVKTMRINSFEALIRWIHPEKGFIPPNDFIPIADETELIIPIGEWVINSAAKQLKIWHGLGYDDLKVSVNFSPLQFKDKNLINVLNKAIKESQLKDDSLIAEVVESATMSDINRTIDILKKMKDMKIDVAIDDFGTGYSSMEYLSKFPIDCLKIDMSFVKNLFKDSKNMAITKSIIALGYNLGLKIVAEGVETREQLDFLVEKGCDYIQGYFFSKPLPAVEALEFLEKTNKVKMG